MEEKKKHKEKEGNFRERQKQDSDVKCACGCGGFISNRAARDKEKGRTEGYIKGHNWKGKTLPDSAKQKMRDNHADFRGDKNPNFGKGLFGDKNPNWQGGKVKNLYGPGKNQPNINTTQDLEFKRQIKERDGECVLCGNKTRLVVHHIESYVERFDLRFEPKNVVTLCETCHPKADNKHTKDKVKVMLKAYVDSL